MTLTDIKRPQAIAVCKYLVYQALPGMSVSQDTLCLMTPPHPWNIFEDEEMQALGVAHRARGRGRGELAPPGSVTEPRYAT